MYFPSITTILGCLFVCYMAHSIWSIAQLFSTTRCTGKPCYGSYLSKDPKLQLVLFTSAAFNPTSSDVTKVANIKNFDWQKNLQRSITIEIPAKTRKNGTMYLYATLAETESPSDWLSLQRDELAKSTIRRILITEYAVPKAASFNLLGENAKPDRNPRDPDSKPVTHILSKAFITILSDNISVSHLDIPPELGRLIQVHRKHGILPIMQQDFFKTRLMDLVEVDKNLTDLDIEINYSPIGVGKLRLMLQIEHASSMMKQLGFTDRDIDEVKGIFSDTNVYLLCSTLFVGGIHLLFDFLSFKNDVLFWKQKRDYVGLSVRTTLWRGFSQIIVFFYLMDENTSLLVLIPAGIGTVIELWKCKKILKLDLSFRGIKIKTSSSTQSIANAEKITQAFDKEAMRYLSYLLYPLCLCGAIYSLVYQPHRSWYSWTINSLVNGVYAFGFLFMLPQLFVNYKLKSVAALPWRAFMYKAFNTFIDDIFAFIITMPTAHRVACFRDDVVFIIYLYQRWLYPVDKNRTDTGFAIEETTGEEETKKSK